MTPDEVLEFQREAKRVRERLVEFEKTLSPFEQEERAKVPRLRVPSWVT